MLCFHCGKEIADTSQFCPYCGKTTAISINTASQVRTENESSDEAVVTAPPVHEEVSETAGSLTDQEIESAKFNKFDAVVKKNVPYYSSEFEKAAIGQKTKFNWAAFFFGGYFCFYRKCGKLFITYYLLPIVITWTGLAVAGIALTAASPNAVLAGGCIYVIGAVFGLVNAIRFGKNFNEEYYRHCSAVLLACDTKDYGTSIGPVVLLAVGMMAISTLLSLPFQSYEYNPVRWGGAPTPGLAQAWGLMDGEEEPIGTFDLAPNPYYTAMDAYDYNDLVGVLSDYGTAKAFWEKYSDSDNRLCIYNVRLQTHDEISVYDPAELLRFRLSDETTEGKLFYIDYDYMIIGNMGSFAYATDYSSHQVELEECRIYEEWNRSQFVAAVQNTPSFPYEEIPDDLGYFLGEYHMAHNYTMQMNLWSEEYDYNGVSWKQWGGTIPAEICFSFSDNGILIGSGMAYWYPPGSTRPEFEAYFDNFDVAFTMYYDGYNFIVNCPELELYDAPFF